MDYIQTNKDKRKIARVCVQIVILLLIVVVILRAMFVFSVYEPYNPKEVSNTRESGFIALSYFGVARETTDKLIAVDTLKEHLQTLHDQGYVTITAKDIINFYQNKQTLPEKSLFLMFEDGRRDTAIFAQNILEEFNYCATILTYGQNLTNDNDKFLNGEDLKELRDTTYYQLGSNGYRLSYINAFDRYENYIGELESTEFAKVSKYLERDYNHYLMDYIRDENRVAKESYTEMEKRITNDYQELKKVYLEEIGSVPEVHILQHSNTGQFGTNDTVSSVNEENIKNMFTINFNREGSCFNSESTSIYDLTRMQPQPYWTTNHLLMRIQSDTQKEVSFIVGNRKEELDILQGASYFKEETIHLTTLPKSKAIMQLSKEELEDIEMSTTLSGNKAGAQTIYLRSDATCNTAIYIELANDIVTVGEINNGVRSVLQEVSLPKVVDQIEYQTLYQNDIEGQIEVLKMKLEGNISTNKKEEYSKKLEELIAKEDIESEKYIPTIDLKEAQQRQIEVHLKKDKLTVLVDSKEAIKEMPVTITKGNVFIEASWLEYVYSQRNLADDVYDGVFNKIVVESQKNTVFDSCLEGFDKVKYYTTVYFDKVLNWFITTL